MQKLVSEALYLKNGSACLPEARSLPDITGNSEAPFPKPLDRVGMDGVEVAVQTMGEDGVMIRSPARASMSVSLDDSHAKGIHMSRLYLALQEGLDDGPLTPALVDRVLDRFGASHAGLSDRAFLELCFEHLTRRASLLTGLSGWRNYPVRIGASRGDGHAGHLLVLQITYSSTCPCSSALARQLIQEGFREAFAEHAAVPIDDVAEWLGTQQAIAALPHSQRSHAEVAVRLAPEAASYPIDALITHCEAALGTPVQTAVKRSDEQEFARLNAEQLMFCEDAARILARALDELDVVCDYRVRVRHLESLHPHDAVAVVTKGIAGGLEESA